MELEREESRSRIFVALELSNLKWMVAVRLLGDVKTSLYQLSGGDLNGLMGLVDRVRAEADRRGHHDVEVCSCYEAGYDGFWLHRALEARGVRNRVLDSASIKVSRRRKHIKTDRIDARHARRADRALSRRGRRVQRRARAERRRGGPQADNPFARELAARTRAAGQSHPEPAQLAGHWQHQPQSHRLGGATERSQDLRWS